MFFHMDFTLSAAGCDQIAARQCGVVTLLLAGEAAAVQPLCGLHHASTL